MTGAEARGEAARLRVAGTNALGAPADERERHAWELGLQLEDVEATIATEEVRG